MRTAEELLEFLHALNSTDPGGPHPTIPRVGGIVASADPLFEPRSNVYLMSARRRRAAGAH